MTPDRQAFTPNPMTKEADMDDALLFKGLKVIDCASYIAAPAAATVLADFGAEVIKVEPPEGDPYRELWHLPGAPAARSNYAWELDSRHKRSLVLDLKRPEGLAVMHRLIGQADVFITNLPLPVRERLGVAHEQLAPLNERLIYASFTAYGEHGPESHKTGFDGTAWWARSGLMDMVRPDHTAVPARATAGMGDHPSAIAMYGAIVTALYRREKTGKGGLVATSLLANGAWSNSVQIQAHLRGAKYPPRPPREQAANPLSNVFKCRDGRWLSMILLNPAKQLAGLYTALGCPELLDDPRYTTPEGLRANAQALTRLFDERFAERDLKDWRSRLDEAGVTFGVIGNLTDIDEDEQMRAAGVLVESGDGSGLAVNSPIHLEGSPKRAPGFAPALGQHSEQVLREAGYGEQDIQALCAAGVVIKNKP